MIGFLVLLAFLALAPAARADMFQDGANAKLPVTGAAAASACTDAAGKLLALGVGCNPPNNAALTALPSTAAASVVRLGFAGAGDAPPLSFRSSSSACSAPDGGSQVAGADGKCWLAVFPSAGADLRQWGAKIDGSTDDTTALVAAVAWANANAGALVFPAAGGISIVKQPLAITASGVSIGCPIGLPSHTDLSAVSTGRAGCWFKWAGAAGQPYVMTVTAPSGSTGNRRLAGFKLRDIAFDGNAGLAKGALQAVSIVKSDVRAFALAFDGGEIFSFDVVHRTPTNFGEACDTQYNDLTLVTSNYGRTSGQIGLHAWVNPAVANNGCNVSVNNIKAIMNFGASPGLLDEGGDNNTLGVNGFTSDAAQNCVDLSIRNDGGNLYAANSEHFTYYSCNAKFIARGTTSFPSCVAGTSCVMNNIIDFLDNGNGTPWPVSEPGTRMVGTSGTGVYWRNSTGPQSPHLAAQGYLTGGGVGPKVRLSGNQPTVGPCTGLGTGGTCALGTAATDSAGIILLNTGTAGTAATGNIDLNFYAPIPFAQNFVICTANVIGEGAGWIAPFGIQVGGQFSSKVIFTWTNTGNLQVSTNYGIGYHCLGT